MVYILKRRLCLFFILFPVIFFCQPGYMGKKTALGGGIYFSPALFGSNANNRSFLSDHNGSSETGHFNLNITYDLFVERVISNRWLFGTSVKYIHTGYDNRSYGYYGKPEGYYKINAVIINPYFKHYSRRTPAPLGKYFYIGPSLQLIFTKHDNYMYVLNRTSDGHDTLISNYGPPKQMHYGGDLMVGFGKTRVIKNKILIDYGYNAGVISVLHTMEALGSNLIFGGSSKSDYIERTSRSRIRNATRFNLFFRIAYLL